MIFLVLLLFTTTFAQESPLEQLIREAIFQANKANVQNHHDVMEINGFKYDSHVSLEVGKISASNFSTIALKGTPDVQQIDKENGTSYNFDLAVGLDILRLQFDYNLTYWFFSSSGEVAVQNSGNAIRTRGVVNTYNGKTPCDSVLLTVEIDSLGSLDVEFGRSGIWNWILGHVIQLGYRMGGSFVRPWINQMIADQVKTTEFQSMFSKAACAPFDF